MTDPAAPAEWASVDVARADAAAGRTCGSAFRPDARRTDALVVLDTNCVLDAWLFEDPRVAALPHAIRTRHICWIATPAMRSELMRVLGYPALTRPLAARGLTAESVLGAFDRWAQPVAPARASALRCTDPDDQMFIDLAVQWHAALFSRDRAVRALAQRLRPEGVRVWPAGADVPSGARSG